jgi:hypothetical protein
VVLGFSHGNSGGHADKEHAPCNLSGCADDPDVEVSWLLRTPDGCSEAPADGIEYGCDIIGRPSLYDQSGRTEDFVAKLSLAHKGLRVSAGEKGLRGLIFFRAS